MDGKKTDQAGGCEAEDCREQDIHANSQEEAVNDSSDDGSKAIYTLSHDERHLPGEDVAQHSAADSGENSDEGTEKQIVGVTVVKGSPAADHDKGCKPCTVCRVQNGIAELRLSGQKSVDGAVADKADKGHQRGQCSHGNIDGCSEHHRRCYPENQVTDHSPSDCSGTAKNHCAKDIHLPVSCNDHAGYGKGGGTNHFKNKDKF